jgi:L-2-hydroxycarboxylate dehydrogenase (NAD+)
VWLPLRQSAANPGDCRGREDQQASDGGAHRARNARLGADGSPTRNAAAVAHNGGVAAFGGHKGYGLSFAIQALGLLAGAEPQDYGFLFIAIDPAMLVQNFPTRMTELVARIKATPRRAGVEEIRIPSERAFREREQRRREGIVLDRKVVDALNAL